MDNYMDNTESIEEMSNLFDGKQILDGKQNFGDNPKEIAARKKAFLSKLEVKYKELDGKIYKVTTTIGEDDEDERELSYIFRKPKTSSYDRYVKTASISGSKALRSFIQDNIVEEQLEEVKEILEEYPAMAISVGEKLLYMLGLSKETAVKKL